MMAITAVLKSLSLKWAEPTKAKKRLDPAVIKAREDRKRRKLEKMIRNRQKLDKQLKPIEECEMNKTTEEKLKLRQRVVNISEAVKEERAILMKKWCSYKQREGLSNILLIDRLINCQQNALNELRLESEELYQAAVKIDEKLIPLSFKGPVESPPKRDYSTPDGEYIDTSKKWL
ncbi:hypothetical protein RUM44_000467 [Polyplax serrata]|uniref:Large ribosomal subunit protein mL40 n=1 Tax=Polyplax serrata TaxID=468196 RepID=A0ABR1B6P0_POLSC